MRTGLSAHVIRVWERRYAAIVPQRKDTKHRLYSEADIHKLRLLHRATLAGHAIGAIANYSIEQLEELLEATETELMLAGRGGAPAGDSDQEKILAGCKAAALELNARQLEAALLEGQRRLSLSHLLTHVIVPFLEWVGEEWRLGNLLVAQEHAVSAVLREFLGSVRQSISTPGTPPTIILTTPAGQLHEFGALLVAIVAAIEGWRDVYLGPNLPADEIAKAAIACNARAVGISIVHPAEKEHLLREVEHLRKLLSRDVPLIIGGRGAQQLNIDLERMGAWVASDLIQVRRMLESVLVGARSLQNEAPDSGAVSQSENPPHRN